MTAGQPPVADPNDQQAALRARLRAAPSDSVTANKTEGPAVTVTGVMIPFGDMVALCFKWFFAMLVVSIAIGIPAAIIYAIVTS